MMELVRNAKFAIRAVWRVMVNHHMIVLLAIRLRIEISQKENVNVYQVLNYFKKKIKIIKIYLN
jgi:hypothetical protein